MALTRATLSRIRELRDKKAREAAGLFVVEGPKVVGELLQAGLPFTEIYATAEWSPPGPTRALALTRVSASEMSRLSHYPTPSAVLAVGAIERRPLPPQALQTGLTLALDGVQDPGNVGTLLRIADWFGLARVLLSPDCADLFHQKVINASMGSFARVAVHQVDLTDVLSAAAVPVFGCDLQGTSLYELEPPAAAVIVIGSEGRGLSPTVAARVTQRLTIPRFGGAESLNAAVAAGIVVAQWRRRG